MLFKCRPFVILAGLLVLGLQAEGALKCYQCNSDDSESCGKNPKDSELIVCELPEPTATEPTATGSTASETSATQSTASETSATQPTATQSTATQSTATQPTATQPTATQSTATQSTATQSTATQSTATQSTATQSTETQSTATESTETQSTTTGDSNQPPKESEDPNQPGDSGGASGGEGGEGNETGDSNQPPKESEDPNQPGNSGGASGGDGTQGIEENKEKEGKGGNKVKESNASMRRRRSILINRFSRGETYEDVKFRCYETVTKEEDKNIVRRGCTTDENYCSGKDTGCKVCDTEACNSVTSISGTFLSMILSLAVVVLFTK